uniref:Uncharacterized protein n=1 Tax=Ascaris lumbricoides TaxID=6252 RepID=A0A9J2P313_ASCLU
MLVIAMPVLVIRARCTYRCVMYVRVVCTRACMCMCSLVCMRVVYVRAERDLIEA